MRHSIGVRSEKKQVKLDRTTSNTDVVAAGKETQGVFHDNNLTAADVIYPASILGGSSHCDGAIYKKDWEACYIMDIADRNESK